MASHGSHFICPAVLPLAWLLLLILAAFAVVFLSWAIVVGFFLVLLPLLFVHLQVYVFGILFAQDRGRMSGLKPLSDSWVLV